MVEIVTGAPFSGKALFVGAEVERREDEGELGLVVLDWTALFTALVPGVQSAFRDERVADTGAPRMVSYVYAAIAAQIAARELRGYLVTQSPRRAVEFAGRFNWEILEVQADVGDIAERAESHMTTMRRKVRRASRSHAVGRCRRAAVTYQNEAPALEGRAREVKRRGKGWRVGETKPRFDRALWLRGLTPRGREAVDELIAAGNPEPMPADVMAWLLRDRR